MTIQFKDKNQLMLKKLIQVLFKFEDILFKH